MAPQCNKKMSKNLVTLVHVGEIRMLVVSERPGGIFDDDVDDVIADDDDAVVSRQALRRRRVDMVCRLGSNRDKLS